MAIGGITPWPYFGDPVISSISLHSVWYKFIFIDVMIHLPLLNKLHGIENYTDYNCAGHKNIFRTLKLIFNQGITSKKLV